MRLSVISINNLVRLVDIVQIFLPILPEIEVSSEKIAFDERVIFTIGSALIYLVGQLPIFGLKSNASQLINDPFYSFRSIFAMEKATLFELGLLPVITSGFIWQLAVGLRLINVNLSLRSDRELFQSAQKLTTFILIIFYALELIFGGYFDNVIQNYNPLTDPLPIGSYISIFFQIVGWNFLVTLIIEIFDKGYAFGSGIICFLALQSATNFTRDLIGFESFKLINSNKSQSIGALNHLIRNFKIWDLSSLKKNVIIAFTRLNLPNLTQFYIGLASLAIVIVFQNFRIEIPIRSTKVRGMNNSYPIKLLYTGALPILFAFTIIANNQFFGYTLINLIEKFGLQSKLTESLIGSYKLDVANNILILNSGIFSYFTSALTFYQSVTSPIRAIVYSLTILVSSIWFANKWANISGSSPKDISVQFKEQGISISGRRDISVAKELSRVIPVAAVSGAAILAVSAIVGEYFGGLGRGVSIIVGVSSTFGVLEEFLTELKQNGGASQFTNSLGSFAG
jgi:protein transport protein SEC61 subunit alpha